MVKIEGVLVPVDFSKQSVLAAKFAASLAQEYKTKLYVLHVRTPLSIFAEQAISNYQEIDLKAEEQARAEITKIIPQAVKELIQVEEIVEPGTPVHHRIVTKAEQLGVDLIVIATHGRTGLSHVLLGSVAEHVIRYAPCPVFVVRNPKDKYVYGWE
jgi:universal stress protein A